MENKFTNKKTVAILVVAVVIIGIISFLSLAGRETPKKELEVREKIISKEVALRSFPVYFPIERDAEPQVDPKVSNAKGKIVNTYSYISYKKLADIEASFISFLDKNKWQSDVVENSPTQKTITALDSDAGDLLTIQITTDKDTALVSIVFSQVLYSISGLAFPADFPKEAGAKVVEPTATSSVLTSESIMMSYYTNLSIEKNYDIFTAYLESNGWSYEEGPYRTKDVKHIRAVRLNVMLDIIVGPVPKTNNKIGVSAILTIIK